MKKLLLAAAVFAALAVQAQKKDTLEIKIGQSVITILSDDMKDVASTDLNKLIKDATEGSQAIAEKHEARMAEIQRRQDAGEITPEQAEEEREKATQEMEAEMEAFEARIEAQSEAVEAEMEALGAEWEAWGEAYGAQWEAWAEQWESRAEGDSAAPVPPMPPMPPVPGKDYSDKVIGKKTKRKPKRTDTYVDFHWGLNQWVNPNGELSGGNAELQTWKSDMWEFGMGGKTRLGGEKSPVYLKWGGSFTWHDFRLKGDRMIEKTQLNGVQFLDTNFSISKSQLNVTYLNIPLMLQLDFSKHGRDEGFTLGVGGYAGVRIHTDRELEYNDFAGDQVEVEQENNFYANNWRYGLTGQIGYGSFKITANYDLNTFFQNNKGPDYQLASITLGFTF